MSNAQIRATGGLVTSDGVSNTPPGGLTVATKLLLDGFFVPPDKGDLGSHAYYDRTVGELTLYPLPDRSGVQVTVKADFPDTYLGTYCVLRGRYEYKDHPEDPSVEVIYEQVDAVATDVTFIDTVEYTASSTEPGAWYYYTVVAVVSIDGGPSHLAYNPNTGMGSAFRYMDKGHAAKLYQVVPSQFRRFDASTFTERYLSIFGYLLDTLFTDIQTYLIGAKDITNVEDSQLERLAAYVGWPITREVNGLVTREEIRNSRQIYAQKGRNNALEYNIQLISGWDVEFEAGLPRVLTSNTEGHTSFDPTDTYTTANIGVPVRSENDELLGVSSGAADQTFDLAREAPINVNISVCDLSGNCTSWREVSDLTGADSDAEVYSIEVDPVTYVGTILFGDGTEGAVPDPGLEIRARYQYGGDRGHYSQAGLDSWEHATGFRLLLEETGSSRPLTTPLMSKVDRIVQNLASSYAVYKITIVSDTSELFAGFQDSFVDTIETYDFFTMDESADLMDDSNTVMR